MNGLDEKNKRKKYPLPLKRGIYFCRFNQCLLEIFKGTHTLAAFYKV